MICKEKNSYQSVVTRKKTRFNSIRFRI